ncbi:MAG: hypothetical protein RO257_01815 [Candidatus Kapabacteria bacterium]|nr:hypothetical protein [Candidatus Kapabacteria bacterium]
MATNPELKRNYHISDGELAVFANGLTTAITRDLTQQQVYGVTTTSLDDFNDLINEFQALPGDDVLRNNLSYSVELRETSRNSILNTMRSISLRAKAVFGANNATYRSLSPGNISQLPDSNLLIVAGQVHDAALLHVAELTAEGVTTVYLTNFKSDIESFELAIKSVLDHRLLRDDGIEAKILKGNELYALIVKYCDYGKLIWSNSSPAKYNDYVIYDSFSPGSLTAPENLSVDVATMTFTWSSVENSTSYQLLTSIAGVEWVEIYAGPDNFVNYVPPSSGLAMYKVKARSSSGYGPESAVMYYNYQPVIAAPGYISLTVVNAQSGAIAINWEEVSGGEFYRLYRSQVALGSAVAGEYTLVGEYTTASYSGTFPTGYRYWFQVFAGNSELLSTASDAVYVDMPLVP